MFRFVLCLSKKYLKKFSNWTCYTKTAGHTLSSEFTKVERSITLKMMYVQLEIGSIIRLSRNRGKFISFFFLIPQKFIWIIKTKSSEWFFLLLCSQNNHLKLLFYSRWPQVCWLRWDVKENHLRNHYPQHSSTLAICNLYIILIQVYLKEKTYFKITNTMMMNHFFICNLFSFIPWLHARY